MTTQSEEQVTERGGRMRLVGTVKQASAPKTVVVSVQRHTQHKTYGRYMRRTKRYMAHDEHGVCKVGDRVVIIESRPLSKKKRWRVSSIVESARS